MVDYLDDRLTKAEEKVAQIKQQQRQKELRVLEAQRLKDQRRNIILGELISKFFPEVLRYEPGNPAKNAVEFAPFAAFLAALADNQDILAQLKDDASRRASADNP